MKRILLITSLLFLFYSSEVFPQPGNNNIEVFLLTCGPGTETYSVYGHSALRIVIPDKKSDVVYNWGVFDFSTPNFTWKFAKGRLDYMLGVEALQRFLQGYFYEERYVYSQKINLEPYEVDKLFSLISDNLKPENINYRYDFFYDDCSTRIRDLLEKSVGDKLLYPPANSTKKTTFREMVGKYQDNFPWLQFGIDLIMGSPGDKQASFRDKMFLPLDMKDGLSETFINRSGKMIPLLQNPEMILDFDPPVVKKIFFTTPAFLFTLLLIIMIILSSTMKNIKNIRKIDIVIFSIFSILSILMIFFNFFTDHLQMKWNLNILWLNPFIMVCLIMLILNKPGLIWYRLVFYISTVFFIAQFLLPQAFNIAILPLVLILMLRSSVRADFNWNPFSLERVE